MARVESPQAEGAVAASLVKRFFLIVIINASINIAITSNTSFGGLVIRRMLLPVLLSLSLMLSIPVYGQSGSIVISTDGSGYSSDYGSNPSWGQDGSISITTGRSGFYSNYGGYSGIPQGYGTSLAPIETGQQSSDTLMKYQEFYSFDQGPQTQGLVQFDINRAKPTYLIINGQSQPYNPSYVPINSLWIQGTTSWTQYIQCPLNARFKLLTFSRGGPATMVEEYSNGHQTADNYQFYPGYTQGVFWADAVGRHTLTFSAYGQKSNSVVVDVVPYSGQYIGPTQIPSTTTRKTSINIGYTGQGAIQQPQNIPQQTEPNVIPDQTIKTEPVEQSQGAVAEGAACPCVGKPCLCPPDICPVGPNASQSSSQLHGTVITGEHLSQWGVPDCRLLGEGDNTLNCEKGKCYCDCRTNNSLFLDHCAPDKIWVGVIYSVGPIQCPGSTVEQPQEIPQPPTDQSSPDGQEQGNEMFMGYEKTGYKVYLDGNYVGTEGENGDALDGNFIIHDISCWATHTIVVDDGEFTHTLEYPFDCGTPYSINVGDDLFVVGSSQ